MKIGIAVSLYDKFEDLEILVDILRENFENEYYIAVCSEHENAEEKLEEIDIDKQVESTGIKYPSSLEDKDYMINLFSRIYESVKSTCLACEEADCEYVMHLHADAWPLEEEKIEDIIREMEEKEKYFAFRGPGSSFQKASWVGHMMDQFFMYKTEELTNLWDKKAVDLLPHLGVHNMFFMLMCGHVGRSNSLQYDDMSEDEFWDGEKTFTPALVRPMCYSPRYKLLHVATEDFPNQWGKSIQAIYLKENGLQEGENISKFIESHYRERSELEKDIRDYENRLDFKLKLMGYNLQKFYRNISRKESELENSLIKKAGILALNLARLAYNRGNQLLLRIMPKSNAVLLSRRRYFEQQLTDQDMLNESEYPKKETDIYRENTKKDEFPEGYLSKLLN